MTEETTKPKRKIWRWLLISSAGLGVLLLLVFFGLFVGYKTGYLDNYIKAQFVAKMADIGIIFEADTFRVTVAPIKLELKNVTFNDKMTGEKLFFIRDANLGLTVENLYAWQLSRDIKLETTDINGAEIWVKFDENGKSNFSNLNLVEDQAGSRVNFKYDSVNFTFKDGIVHFGDAQHKISANAKNVVFLLSPINSTVPDELKRYNFELTSTKSNFIYDEKVIDPIDLRAKGIADGKGAEINEFALTTPLGETVMNGKLTDWERLQYDLKIKSTVDLQQTATLLPNGTALRGFGNFEGTVTGEGEKYQINGEVTSESLAASNIRLKGLQVNAKISGENSIYEGNGKAIAEMLTYEDFQIDFPQLIGNVRGNGTDFKWFGELQAAAAKSPDGTLAGLFISDAVAEYKDKEFSANFGSLRANSLVTEDLIAQNLRTGSIKISSNNGTTTINAPNAQAKVIKAEGTELTGVNANGIKVTNRGNKTDAEVNNLRAETVRTKDTKLKNVTVNGVNLTTQNGATDIQAKNVQADGVDAEGAKIGNLQAGNVNVKIRGNQTDIDSGNVKIARIDTTDASFGSLNVAGVRLRIVGGRVEGSSGDIDAGNVDLKKNGKLENAKLYKPVFVLEPSGRYRASMDMSLGGGILGSVKLGAARASVIADNDKVTLNNLTADVMDGKINGNATIAMNQRTQSKVDADFTNLDLAKILALQGGKVVPIAGKTTGKANLFFAGTNFKNASGTLTADFDANAGSDERGLVPINGNLGLRATNGLFDIDYAKFNTEKSSLNATGRFDLSGSDSNLNLALDSSDATEITRLVKVLDLSPELEQQLNENELAFAGNLNFNGTVTGNLENPNVNGRAAVDSVSMRGRELGSLATNILVSPTEIQLNDGILRESNGGNATFSLNIPQVGANNISVQAKLNRVNAGNILAALPFLNSLPEKLRDFNAETSGTLNLTGLPNEMDGVAELSAGNGTVSGEKFDSLQAKATFNKTLVTIETGQINFGKSYLRLNGTYDRQSTAFDFNFIGSDLETEQLARIFASNPSFPKIKGLIQANGKATGNANDFGSYNVRMTGAGSKLTINDNQLGGIGFNVQTENKILSSVLLISFPTHQQKVLAEVDLGNESLPLKASTEFYQTELAPFIALFQPPDSVAINGKATGNIVFGGNLYDVTKKEFTDADLRGTANFSELGLQFDETPIVSTKPIKINFNTREVVIDGNATFSGAGSNLIVSGTKALNDTGINNLAVDGKINLRLLNLTSKNTFYSGLADISVRLTGVNKESRLSGSASVDNASISAFVGSERLNFERIKGRVIFNSNQAQIDQAVAYLGGGKVVASGGALVQGLKLQQFRLDLRGQNITAPLPKDFLTTGDAEVQVTGKCEYLDEVSKICKTNGNFSTLITGTIYAKRSSYTKDIDLADLISSRRDASISEGAGTPAFGLVRLDLRLQGRDALVVRNNIADLTASVDLRVTGDVDYPVISGRVTANSGLVFFRSDRYTVNRGTLEFPPQTDNEPVINLQAETDIKGYQVFVNLVGELSNIDALNATVRSNPALPQGDVISLITTGNLTNSDSGIPTYAQSGINTAAEVITDSLINNPVRKATDKLFGLNKFEIDPILSGRRLNPTARLTVGRQINKNLAITYSTNLSEDQNQVLAFEYRVSNRLSFVAQYEQGSLSNVTRNNNNFSFEIRLRKRF